MFGGRKRPWRKHARIHKVEYRSGDVKYEAWQRNPFDGTGNRDAHLQTFETLTEAEDFLDNWFADFWPKQERSRRRA